MRALYADPDGLRWVEREPRPLDPSEVRVRVHASPVTGLDRDVAAGRSGFAGIPGHCFVGSVIEGNGPVAAGMVGRRVVPLGSWGCGVCDACAAGFEDRCPDRRIPGLRGADGAHAEEIVVPARALHPVDPVLTDESAALLPMVASVYDAIVRADLPEWTNVLVIGDGSAGLLASISLASAGYTVTLRGRHGDRFDLVRRFRVNFVLTSADPDTDSLRPGRSTPSLLTYPYVVDASGDASGWQAAVEFVSPAGTILCLTSAYDGVPRPLHRVQEKSIRVMGLREGPLAPAVAVVAQGLFDPTQIINRVFDFEDAPRAYAWAQTRDAWMPLLRMPV